MRLRTSTCGVLVFDGDRPVWDDYLDHQRYALDQSAPAVLSWFSLWRDEHLPPPSTTGPDAEAHHRHVVEQLREAHILVAEGSSRAAREAAIQQSWGEWGPIARAFHYATRTDSETPYLDAAEHSAALRAALPQHPPPRATAERGTGVRLPLPRWQQASWQHRDLIDVLYRRRSSREFGDVPVPLPAVGALLELTATIVTLDEDTQTVGKTSPSGGGRHPTELYVWVRDVADLAPGIYHYRSGDHELAYVKEPPSGNDLVAACADQTWVLRSALVVFFTSVFARTTWKYQRPRSYRVLNLDVGHLGQTLALTATALGLNSTFTAALRDELVEQHLGCDPATELVLGCAVIGSGPPGRSGSPRS